MQYISPEDREWCLKGVLNGVTIVGGWVEKWTVDWWWEIKTRMYLNVLFGHVATPLLIYFFLRRMTSFTGGGSIRTEFHLILLMRKVILQLSPLWALHIMSVNLYLHITSFKSIILINGSKITPEAFLCTLFEWPEFCDIFLGALTPGTMLRFDQMNKFFSAIIWEYRKKEFNVNQSLLQHISNVIKFRWLQYYVYWMHLVWFWGTGLYGPLVFCWCRCKLLCLSSRRPLHWRIYQQQSTRGFYLFYWSSPLSEALGCFPW